MIELLRKYQPTRTLGFMTLEDGTELHTMEKAWHTNVPSISCIPEGIYPLIMRDSDIVRRTTRNRPKHYEQGWEVTQVPNRSLIMLHIANFPYQLLGCIAVGLSHGILKGNFGEEMAVLKSGDAFDILMASLSKRDEWYLEIKTQ